MRHKDRFSWRGLAPQLFTIVVLPLSLILVLVTFGSLALHQRSMRVLAAERDERAARAAALTLSDAIKYRATLVRSIALRALPAASASDLAGVLDEYRWLDSYFDGGLAFYDNRGHLLVSFGDAIPEQLPAAPSSIALPVQNTAYYLTQHPSGSTLLFLTAQSDRAEVVAVGVLDPSILIQQALQVVFSPQDGTAAYVVDQQHRMIYQRTGLLPGEEIADHPGILDGLQGNSGFTYMEQGEDEHIVAYSSVPDVGWALVIEEPWHVVASPTLRITENSPLVLIPVVLFSILTLWFATRRIVQPLQALEAQAAELGRGNFQAVEEPVGGISEIRNLQTEMIYLAHKVQAAQESLHNYIGAITLGQEEERRRLARELHDDTLQSLIALNQRVQLAALALNSQPQGAQYSSKLSEIQSLAEQTIQNLRRLTRALRPIYLEELGLAAALEMLARESNQNEPSHLRVDFHRTGAELRLPANVELALYRMAQEALSNIVRHAGASRARLQVTFSSELVTLEITDNGKGFEVPDSPSAFSPAGHYGLLGLYERAEMIGAHLEIKSAPQQGARVTVILPLSNSHPVQV